MCIKSTNSNKNIKATTLFVVFLFVHSWEQRKLSDIAIEMVAGGDIDKNLILDNGRYPVIANALTNDGIVGYYNSDYRIKAPAVTVTGRGDVGHAKARLVNFTPVVRLLSIKSKHNVFFLENAINTLKIVIESTGVPQLTVPQLEKYEVIFPQQLTEEKKIGTFFNSLNNLITLHQCKVFYKNIIFKNIKFGGLETENDTSWEQRELSKICSMHARIGWQNLRTSEFLDSGDYYLITGTDFVDGRVDLTTCHYVDKARYEQDKKIQLSNGSILITKDGTLGKVAIIEDLDKPATLNAGVFNVEILSNNVDNLYLYQYLRAPFLMDYVDKKSTGGTIKHLNQNILVSFPVLLPSYQEQKLIGRLFQEIDNLITLHQRIKIFFTGDYHDKKNK